MNSINPKIIKNLSALVKDNSVIAELISLYSDLNEIKKQRNLIISAFAIVSLVVIWVISACKADCEIWFLTVLLLIHDIVFAKVFRDITKEEQTIASKIIAIQSSILQSI